MSGGVDTTQGYHPKFSDSREVKKVKPEMLGLKYGDRFKNIFERSLYDTIKKNFEPLDAIGSQLKAAFEPPKETSTQSNKWHPFIMASFNCEVSRVKAMLKKGKVDVNMVTKSEGFTALMVACGQGHTEVARLLIKYGAKCDTVSYLGSSALLLACMNDHHYTAKLLLENCAKPNTWDKRKCTALMMASFYGHYRIAELLLRYNAEVNIFDSQQQSALMLACNNGHYDVAELLLRHKAQIDAQDIKGMTALMFANINNHIKTVNLLLFHGAKIDMQEKKDGCSVLFMACHLGYYRIASLLLEYGADLNLQNRQGISPLITSSRMGHTDIVQLLLDNGAKVDEQENTGLSSLMVASHHGHYDIVKLLLDRNAQIDLQATNKLPVSALIFAGERGHYNVCKLLLERGAKIELQETSALILAANNEIIQLLLESGAKIDYQDNRGYSALTDACFADECDRALMLLEQGATVDLLTKNKFTSLMISSLRDKYDVTKLLLDHGADPNMPGNKGQSSLHLASMTGCARIVELLLARGAQPYLRDLYGNTALTLAGNIDTIHLLMDITEFSRKDLFIALQYAVSTNNDPLVHYHFNKCLKIIGESFCLNADLKFPGIAFFKDKVENWITPKGADHEIECAGLSISIPKDTIAAEDSTDLLVRPCFSGPFELPAKHVSASPAYLIQPARRATMKKDVTVRIHHHADLRTEEDCKDMVFLSANPTPHKSSNVYRFEKNERVRGCFRVGDPVGEIKLRHFCLIKVARWVGERLRRRHNRISPGNIDRYSARLYRNMSPDAHSGVSAVFCVCLDHPLYIEHCDSKIQSYYAISKADLSVEKGIMVSDEIVISDVPAAGWKVSFDRKPTKIIKRDLNAPLSRLVDYPPQFLVFVRQTSIHESSDICVPELRVQGLDKGECCFQLIIPGRGSPMPTESSLLSSYQDRFQGSVTSSSLCEDTSQSGESGKTESLPTLTHFNVLTALDSIAKEWRDIGLSLRIDYAIIDKIETDHSTSVKRCLAEVINCWLKGNGGEKSWSFLCGALRSKLVKRSDVAEEIEQTYMHAH